MKHSNSHERLRFFKILAKAKSPKHLYQMLTQRKTSQPARTQPEKMQYSATKMEGPMNFLGLQIVKKMQSMGWDAKIFICYRSPKQQQKEYDDGDSKALPWQSPHQWNEAVDIVHRHLFWQAPQEFWDALALCAREVEKQYKVDLELGYDWGWDSAHIELTNWREVRKRQNGNYRPLTTSQLLERFVEVLPQVKLSQNEKSILGQGS